jgi:hypothetical protein
MASNFEEKYRGRCLNHFSKHFLKSTFLKLAGIEPCRSVSHPRKRRAPLTSKKAEDQSKPVFNIVSARYASTAHRSNCPADAPPCCQVLALPGVCPARVRLAKCSPSQDPKCRRSLPGRPLSRRSQGSARAPRLHAKAIHRGLDPAECRQLRLYILETAEISLAGILT